VLKVPIVVAAVAVVAVLGFLCAFYFSCIRKTDAKNKIYVMMNEAKLDIEEADEGKDDFDDEAEDDDW
jgi:hypothetical protein